jgi:hypothetical protein
LDPKCVDVNCRARENRFCAGDHVMRQARFCIPLSAVTLTLLGGGTIASAQLTIATTPSTLSFQAQGGQLGYPLDSSISVTAPTATQFAVSVDQSWVSISDASSDTPITPTTVLTTSEVLLVRVKATPVTPGKYLANIYFYTPPGTLNPTNSVPVALTVGPAGSGNLILTPSALTFNYLTGAPYPQAQTITIASSTAGSVPISLTSYTVSGGPWLSVATNSYFTPALATVYAAPLPGMAPGAYTGAVYVVPFGGTGIPQTVPVTMVVSTIGLLTASPPSLTFNYQSGGALPAPQTLTVVNALGGNVAYNVATSTSSGGNWLSTSTSYGTTPSSFLVSVSSFSLSTGTYYGTVNIYPVGSTVPSSQVPVILTVLSGSQLIATPATMSFNYVSGGAAPLSQFITVTSTGAPITFNASVAGPSWITLSTSSAITPTAVLVNVNPPAGIAAGTYSASVLLTPVGGGKSVAVSIAVKTTAANYLSVNPTSITFEYTLGGPNPAPAVVSVTTSSGPVQFDAITAAVASPSWLKASSSSQYTPATVTVTANPQGLGAGTYPGILSIESDDADNSPQTISVTLIVTKASTLTLNPFSMSFSYQIGQANPPFQLGVVSSQDAGVPFGVSTATFSGGSWLLAAGDGATPSTVIAGISPNLLAGGTYSGTLNIHPSDSTLVPLQVPVTLNVASVPVFVPSTNQLTFQYRLSGPVPQVQKINLRASDGGTIVYYPTVNTGDGGQWLKVSPNVNTTPSDVSIAIDPAGLAAGFYYGTVLMNDTALNAPSAYVPVSLQVSSGPILSVPGQPLVFTAQPGSAPVTQQITVGGNGNSLPYHVDTSATWLQVLPSDGSTDSVLNVVATPPATAGYYVATITITIPGVAGSQQYVPVALVVR